MRANEKSAAKTQPDSKLWQTIQRFRIPMAVGFLCVVLFLLTLLLLNSPTVGAHLSSHVKVHNVNLTSVNWNSTHGMNATIDKVKVNHCEYFADTQILDVWSPPALDFCQLLDAGHLPQHIDLFNGTHVFNRTNGTGDESRLFTKYHRGSVRILGLHKACGKRFTRVSVAGLYHTGTNALTEALNQNELRLAEATNMSVLNHSRLWFKHALVTDAYLQQTVNDWSAVGSYLAVLSVRHPLAWFKSMCHYYLRMAAMCETQGAIPKRFRFDHIVQTAKEIPVNQSVSGDDVYEHESIVHWWNKYYSLHLSAAARYDYGLIVVRFEDMLSATLPLVETIGVKVLVPSATTLPVLPDFWLNTGAAKMRDRKHTRSYALEQNMNLTLIKEGYTSTELQYYRENVNHTLMDLFGYLL